MIKVPVCVIALVAALSLQDRQACRPATSSPLHQQPTRPCIYHTNLGQSLIFK